MESVLSTPIRTVLEVAGPASSAVQTAMETRADETGFPVVGPEVGGVIRLLTRLIGARRVFEFGSGFGYSATWFAAALPSDGSIILTEQDADELDAARGYLAEAGLADVATFESGDAFEIFDRYPGPFDVIFLDCQKVRYPDAIEPVRSKLSQGGLLLADNALQGPFSPPDLSAGLDGRPTGPYAEEVAGIAEYLERVRDDSAFETVVLPLGEGLAVSHYSG